jgi:enoyl-CoA hydratase/carnithine racemase
VGTLIDIVQLDDCAVVRLNRPEKKNALNRLARRELLAALLSLRDRRAIILTGAGDSFCSGVDLKEVKTAADADVPPDPQSDWIEVLLAIREHPAVCIAAVNGFALGGGATLISVCDLAIAADEAEIGMPEIGFGVYPQFSGPGAQMQLTAKRAAWLILTAERVDGRTAEMWGMVNRSVPRAELMQVATSIGKKLGEYDAVALSESKHALDVVPASISDWRQAFVHGMSTNARIRAASDAQQEGFSRFASGLRNPGQGRLP